MNMQSSPEKYQSQTLDSMEIDTIGEILNISMGAAATAVSVMLNRQVTITTPSVKVVESHHFDYVNLEPALGIEIEYVEGLHGSNVMIMSVRDVKAIVNVLLEGSMEDDGGELDEIHISALGEIMNQMMGASCTALASFLNRSINMSTPMPFQTDELPSKLSKSGNQGEVVAISFRLVIENLLDSEFITVMPVSFTKELVRSAMGLEDEAPFEPTDEDIAAVTGHTQVPTPIYEADIQPAPPIAPQSAPAPRPAPVPAPKPATAPAPRPVQAPVPPPPPRQEYQAPRKNVAVQPLQFDNLDQDVQSSGEMDQVNLGLVMDVDLSVTVEIGRTKKQVKEILAFRQGSIVELDKQAGEPVDIVVNGKMIARGDVVVIDDNFGVRITEIVGKINQK